jgi:hypothetical protein
LTKSVTEAAIRVLIEAYLKRYRIAPPITNRIYTYHLRYPDLLLISRALIVTRHSTFGLVYRIVFDELAENILYCRPYIASLPLFSLESSLAVAVVVAAGQSALIRYIVVFYTV